MLAMVLTSILITAAQSPATMASVAVFAANAERKWPADDREPFVTGEALRLMEAAAAAIADDAKINTGKVHDAIVEFSKVRLVATDHATAEDDRAAITRDALIKGESMINALAAALHHEAASRQQLAALKKSAESIDKKTQLRAQAAALEKYFHDAAGLLRTMLAASTEKT
jgi:hypothetical protein